MGGRTYVGTINFPRRLDEARAILLGEDRQQSAIGRRRFQELGGFPQARGIER